MVRIKFSAHEIVKKEKEICASFAFAPQPAKGMAVAHDNFRWKGHYTAGFDIGYCYMHSLSDVGCI